MNEAIGFGSGHENESAASASQLKSILSMYFASYITRFRLTDGLAVAKQNLESAK